MGRQARAPTCSCIGGCAASSRLASATPHAPPSRRWRCRRRLLLAWCCRLCGRCGCAAAAATAPTTILLAPWGRRRLGLGHGRGVAQRSRKLDGAAGAGGTRCGAGWPTCMQTAAGPCRHTTRACRQCIHCTRPRPPGCGGTHPLPQGAGGGCWLQSAVTHDGRTPACVAREALQPRVIALVRARRHSRLQRTRHTASRPVTSLLCSSRALRLSCSPAQRPTAPSTARPPCWPPPPCCKSPGSAGHPAATAQKGPWARPAERCVPVRGREAGRACVWRGAGGGGCQVMQTGPRHSLAQE